MMNKQLWGLWALVGACIAWNAVGLATYAQRGNFSVVRDPEQVPTARYGRGEAVDLSLIIDEWRDRYPSIPVFACSCNADTCGDRTLWPFREYTRYQPFVSLGDVNATNSEATGFNCFDIETGARPQN